jgi:dihydroxyacetone kinase
MQKLRIGRERFWHASFSLSHLSLCVCPKVAGAAAAAGETLVVVAREAAAAAAAVGTMGVALSACTLPGEMVRYPTPSRDEAERL